MNPFITVKPMGRWAELTIHWETVDGPDSSSVYLPAEDAWEIERKVNEQEAMGKILSFPVKE